MLPLRVRVDQAIKWYYAFPSIPKASPSDSLVAYPGYSLGGSYWSAAPANLAKKLSKDIIPYYMCYVKTKENLLCSGLCRSIRSQSENQRMWKERQVLWSCQRIKKAMKYEGDCDSDYNWRSGNGSPKAWKGDWKNWKLEDESRLSKLQHCWDQPKYRKESWRPERTCCLSASSERLSANASVKKLQGIK